MLKIYSRCLICLLKVKYTKFTLQQIRLPNGLPACQTAGLPAVRPGSTMDRAPFFSQNNGNRVGFTETVVPKNVYALHHGPSFYPSLVNFRLQIAYGKVGNSRIGVNKLVG